MFLLRDSLPRLNPPVMVTALVLANAGVFLFELLLPEDGLEALFYTLGIVPARYSHPVWAEWFGFSADDYWPFVTSMFLHGGFLHIAGNMWTLWIFGDNVEDRMGAWRFLVFYLLCGVGAGVVHWLTNPDSTVPTVGASGAIAGVMGAYFSMFPRAHVVVWFPVLFYPVFLRVPAPTYLFYWLLLQVFSGTLALVGPQQVGGVAWWAHVGGFVAGVFLHPLFTIKRTRRRLYEDELGVEGAWVPAGPWRPR
jgi:membrane associated rhomboid family serine protease